MRYYSSTATVMALTVPVNEIVTTIVVDTDLGLPTQRPFTLVLDVGAATEEIVTVTGVAGTSLTVTRGEDNSTAIAHSIGAVVRHMMTARDLREPATHIDATTYVHGIGATASVVGTDTAQALTNKTINFANNTAIGVPQSAVANLVDDIAALALASADHTDDIAALVLADHNPIGTVLTWAGSATAPTGYLIADGAAVSRTTYSALYAVVGITYGPGNGTTTFNLPALSGRAIVGFDATQTEFDAMGETGGAKTHVLTVAQMPSHTHGPDAAGHEILEWFGTGGNTGLPGGTTVGATSAIGVSGGGSAHNNLQPYIVLRHIIKF